MARLHGAPWYYCYVPHGMAGGGTSAMIPLFAYALGAGLVEVGIVAAATSVASVPAFILWGILSDRLGRRKVFLLIGFLGGAASFAVMALSTSLLEFVAANVLLGFLGAAGGPVGAVLVMETSERKLWAMRLAALSRVGGIGWTAGLALGVGWLASGAGPLGGLAAMRGLFALAVILSVASASLVLIWLREPVTKVDRRAVGVVDDHHRIERGKFLPMRMLHFFDPRNHVRRPSKFPRPLNIYLASVLLLFTGFTGFYGFFPIFLKEAFLLADPDILAVYIASHVTSVLAYARTGRWVDARGSRPMQVYASLGRAALFPSFLVLAALPLPHAARLGVALALHAGVGLCWAVLNVAGTTLVSRLANEGGHAQAMGAYGAIQGIGAMVGPLLTGVVAQVFGYPAAFAVTMASILAGIAILAIDRVPER